MKYIVILCDGMADTPVPSLGGKTPMEAAHKPHIDALAAKAEVGTATSVPAGMAPGSDVANLSIIGYNPADCYTGRSPLEAANIGIELADTDVAMRCNLVTLSDEASYADKTMVDYCAGDIHTAQADRIIQTLQAELGGGEFDFYTGTAYRHCLVWHGGTTELGKITPPHDISGRVVGEYLPSHPAAAKLLDLMKKSEAILKEHPVNAERRAAGLNPATSIWLWGHGRRPQLQNFKEMTGLNGAMISAVDLLKGIGRLSGMQVCEVEGATGYIDTNFAGKLDAAVNALKSGADYAYIHMEAPDECGHRGEAENKVKSIEMIDEIVVGPLLKQLPELGDFTILVCPDHPTPIACKTHVSDPIPYLLYRSNDERDSGVSTFTEATAAATGRYEPHAYDLIKKMIG
ncbi:MAG: cofactor-independent phosphoglycerate mutase [Clostridia bacterium]|nr:cofactor-independent phosphoglycerate mutase [Clostridia bacterium]